MRLVSSITLTAFLLLFASAAAFSQGIPPARSREEFAKAMAKIKEGTTKKRVLAILGRPDDVRMQFDPGGT